MTFNVFNTEIGRRRELHERPPAIVCDIGSGQIRAGWAGDNNPRGEQNTKMKGKRKKKSIEKR